MIRSEASDERKGEETTSGGIKFEVNKAWTSDLPARQNFSIKTKKLISDLKI